MVDLSVPRRSFSRPAPGRTDTAVLSYKVCAGTDAPAAAERLAQAKAVAKRRREGDAGDDSEDSDYSL